MHFVMRDKSDLPKTATVLQNNIRLIGFRRTDDDAENTIYYNMYNSNNNVLTFSHRLESSDPTIFCPSLMNVVCIDNVLTLKKLTFDHTQLNIPRILVPHTFITKPSTSFLEPTPVHSLKTSHWATRFKYTFFSLAIHKSLIDHLAKLAAEPFFPPSIDLPSLTAHMNTTIPRKFRARLLRIYTRSLITGHYQRHNHPNDNYCRFCFGTTGTKTPETLAHLFHDCPFAVSMWSSANLFWPTQSQTPMPSCTHVHITGDVSRSEPSTYTHLANHTCIPHQPHLP